LLNASAIFEDISDNPQLAEYKEDIDLIVEQANRCKKIVSGLLNFSRRNTLIIESVNIDTLIRNSLKAIVKPNTIKIEVKTDFKDPMAEIHGDKITQVLVNLIMNAIDAMENNGTIVINAYDTKDKVIIKIKDTGTGISKKHINKIFEPLFTTKQIGKGTGLGLAVTYGIIKNHKGSITVDTNSSAKNGPTWTEFTVTLPRKN
jgi:signal transduction histidine kinase